MLIKSFKATHQVSKELSLKHCLNYLFELRNNQVVVSASSICHAIAVLTVLSEFITSEIFIIDFNLYLFFTVLGSNIF